MQVSHALFRLFSLERALTESFCPKRIKNKNVNGIDISIPPLFRFNFDVERFLSISSSIPHVFKKKTFR